MDNSILILSACIGSVLTSLALLIRQQRKVAARYATFILVMLVIGLAITILS